MPTEVASTTVAATDGVRLAVHTYTGIDPGRPTVLAIHGYPDNHHVWDRVTAALRHRFNVVAYDVRGAGQSSTPPERSGYRLQQLVADLDAVIGRLGVDSVHLLAHDWGSIQGWAAVTDESVVGKIASFTSISGPHLNYAGRFLRSARTPRGVLDVVKQVLASSYIWFFLTPGVPEWAIRSGATVKVFEAVERIGGSSAGAQRGPGTGRPRITSTGSTCTGRTCRDRSCRRRRGCRRPRCRCRCSSPAGTTSYPLRCNGSPAPSRTAAGSSRLAADTGWSTPTPTSSPGSPANGST